MDINGNTELFEWLEASLGQLVEAQPVTAAIVAIRPDGNVLTGYYNADAQDKAIFAHNINADAMLDTVLNNIDQVRDALDELGE